MVRLVKYICILFGCILDTGNFILCVRLKAYNPSNVISQLSRLVFGANNEYRIETESVADSPDSLWPLPCLP